MSPRERTRPRGVAGLLLAVLALVCQLALGGIVLPDEALAREQSASAVLDPLSVLCVSGAADHDPGQAPAHHRHLPGCVLCPLTVAAGLPAVLPTGAPELPAPSSRTADAASLPPPARAPPARPRPVPPSRGPPVLS